MIKHMRTFIFLLFTAAIILLPACSASKNQQFTVSVGGEILNAEECKLIIRDTMLSVALEYSSQAGMDINSPVFWQTKTGADSPVEKLEQECENILRRTKGIQLLALEHKIVNSIDYDNFIKSWEKENNARQEKHNRGEVIYGPLSYTKEQFYSYRQSELEFVLIDYISSELVKPSAADLLSYYEKISVEKSTMNFKANAIFFYWQEELAGEELVLAIEQAARKTQDTNEICKQVLESTGFEISAAQREINTRDMGREDPAYEKAVAAVRDIEAGQCGPVTKYENMYGVIFLTSKEYEEFGSYEENAAYVESLYREYKANEIIDNAIKQYDVIFGAEFSQITW